MKVLAFDIYGTLINTHGVVARLQEFIGDEAQSFSNLWRDKQLEYSFRRGLMKRYENFAVCTAQALDYTDLSFKTKLTDDQKKSLLESYKTLPAFADVATALTQLKAEGHRLYAFSNGSADAVTTLLASAGISDFFEGIVSCDDIQSFKPNPEVYQHLLDTTGAKPSDTWLISSNPFDIIGAIDQSLNAAWVQRSADAIYDPWGIEATVVVDGLESLVVYLRHV